MMKKIVASIAVALLSTFALQAQADLSGSTTNAYLRGDFNSWGKSPMSISGCGGCQGISASLYVTVGENPGAFKFDLSATGDWSDNYGDNLLTDLATGTNGVQHFTTNKNGNNIPFPCAGTYNVTLFSGGLYDLNRVGGACPVPLTKVYPTMYFRHSVNAWGSAPMDLVANNLWQRQISAPISGGTSLAKFDVAANWLTNFGENNADGIADQGGTNIVVPACTVNGCTMTVRFNDSTKKYAFCQGPVKLAGNASLCF